MWLPLPPVEAWALSCGNIELVRVQGEALDVLGVSQVMSLTHLLTVVEDHHGGQEVNHLSSGQEVEVVPGVSPSVAVHPVQPQPGVGGGHGPLHVEGVAETVRTQQADRPPLDEHPELTLLAAELRRPIHVLLGAVR